MIILFAKTYNALCPRSKRRAGEGTDEKDGIELNVIAGTRAEEFD